jgi:transcriptional regulator with XRE-family HTH domain
MREDVRRWLEATCGACGLLRVLRRRNLQPVWTFIAHVSSLELRERNPNEVTLWHLSNALGVKLRQFFDDERGVRRKG